MSGTTLEHLVEEVGGFGRFQFLLIPLSFSGLIMAVWSMMFMVFGAVQPDWWCDSGDFQTNHSTYSGLPRDLQTYQSTFNSMSRNFQTNQSTYSILHVGENGLVDVLTTTENGGGSFEENGTNGTTVWSCELLTRNDGVCDNIVFTPGLTTIVTEFHLVCDRAWISSMTISLQMVGVLIGSSLAGQLADSIGRKKTVVTFIAAHAIFNLMAAFSITWQMFAVFRTLIGFTTGAIIVASFAYPTEFIGVRWRAVIITIPFWGIGATSTSLLVWVLPHWSHVHIVTAVCTAACLPGWLFLPESVRWLVVKGHVTQAQRVLCQVAKWNRRKAPDFRSVQSLFSDTGKSHKKYNYFHLFSSWELIKSSVLNGFMWFSCSVTYYGISFGIKNLSGDFNLNFFLMAVVELPPTLVIFHLSGWFGRRWTIVGSFLITALAVIVVVPISILLTEEEAGVYVNAMCIVCRIGMNVGWNTMALFLTELYPTVIRNIALGYANTMARVGGILAPYILSIGEPYVFYAIISVGMTLTTLAPVFMRETGGQPLQDELPVSSKHKSPPPLTQPVLSEEKDGKEMVAVHDEQKTSL